MPDELFARLDAHVRARGTTRSGLVAEAMRAYLRELDGEEVMRRLNEAYSDPELVAESLAMAEEGRRMSANAMLFDEVYDAEMAAEDAEFVAATRAGVGKIVERESW